MDRKARIVRFWLLAAAMLAVVVVWQEVGVGLWPVAFFFPTCVCCNTTTCAGACSARTSSMQLVVTGIVDGLCADCDTFNATYLESFNPGQSTLFGACWFQNLPGATCGGSFDVQSRIAIYDNSTTVRVSGAITLVNAGAGTQEGALFERADAGLGSPPADCRLISGLALTYDPSFTNGPQCDWSGSSASANMI